VVVGVDHEVAPIGAGYHRAGIPPPCQVARFVNPEPVLIQVDDQFQRAARNDSLGRMNGRIAQRPHVRDKLSERRARTVRAVPHHFRIPTSPESDTLQPEVDQFRIACHVQAPPPATGYDICASVVSFLYYHFRGRHHLLTTASRWVHR
jgi:hypothetical protein